jgi:ABC-type dipeptide/oligopeptide/nickel transport system ATPase subunit
LLNDGKKISFLDTLFLLRKEECITIFSDIHEISKKKRMPQIIFRLNLKKKGLNFYPTHLSAIQKQQSGLPK